jgi:hypothetical protein
VALVEFRSTRVGLSDAFRRCPCCPCFASRLSPLFCCALPFLCEAGSTERSGEQCQVRECSAKGAAVARSSEGLFAACWVG